MLNEDLERERLMNELIARKVFDSDNKYLVLDNTVYCLRIRNFNNENESEMMLLNYYDVNNEKEFAKEKGMDFNILIAINYFGKEVICAAFNPDEVKENNKKGVTMAISKNDKGYILRIKHDYERKTINLKHGNLSEDKMQQFRNIVMQIMNNIIE